MRRFVKLLSLAAFVAASSALPAHGSIGLVIVLVCDWNVAEAPSRPVVQTSAFFDEVCSPLTFNPPICDAAEAIDEDMSCAAATAALLQAGALQTSVQSAGRPLFIIAEDIEGEAIATGNPHRPTSNLMYINVHSSDGGVGTVGCDFFSADVPIATFVDDSDANGASSEEAETATTCADALQDQADEDRAIRATPVRPPAAPPFSGSPAAPSEPNRPGLPTGKHTHKIVSTFVSN